MSVAKAVQSVQFEFEQLDRALTDIALRLEQELALQYPGSNQANPAALMRRLAKVREMVPELRVDVQELLVAKHALMESAARNVLPARKVLEKWGEGEGGEARGKFEKELDSWNRQVGGLMAAIETEKTQSRLISTDQLSAEVIRSNMLNRDSAPAAGKQTRSEQRAENIENNIENVPAVPAPAPAAIVAVAKPAPAAAKAKATSRPGTPKEQQRASLGRTAAQPPAAAAAAAAGAAPAAADAPISDAAAARSRGAYEPVTEQEFNTLSALVRGRVKLAMLNDEVYKIIYDYFKDTPKSGREPVDAQALTKLGAKVTGATGENCLNCLRHLKVINISKKGIILA